MSESQLFTAYFIVVPVVFSFTVAAALGPSLIAFLHRLSYRQIAYEDAPETHRTKSGTPTMGGLLFIVAPLSALAILLKTTPALHGLDIALAALIIGAGVIGFVDDYSAIRRGRNRGLNARTKFLATGLLAVAFLAYVLHVQGAGIDLLFIGHVPVWIWYALSLAVILATMHAVNLTDGLDGLASGTIIPPLAVFAIAAFRAFGSTNPQISGNSFVAVVFAETTIGAVLAFLLYNRHPAKMFMGDTGSLALGAALAGIAILTGGQLLLLLVGGVFVAETLSVMIQVASYKTTKRRVFRMSPLHHHFELGGWPETKVTASFWTASLVLSLIGFFIVVHA
jgi:phospho-N-acetylmuramoyl-pentapeptide-transferase